MPRDENVIDAFSRLVGWIGAFLEAEAKARTGDPGRVPLRRLSNFEYDCTIRDLTGVVRDRHTEPWRGLVTDGARTASFRVAVRSITSPWAT